MCPGRDIAESAHQASVVRASVETHDLLLEDAGHHCLEDRTAADDAQPGVAAEELADQGVAGVEILHTIVLSDEVGEMLQRPRGARTLGIRLDVCATEAQLQCDRAVRRPGCPHRSDRRHAHGGIASAAPQGKQRGPKVEGTGEVEASPHAAILARRRQGSSTAAP